jgi:hypothetical protein
VAPIPPLTAEQSCSAFWARGEAFDAPVLGYAAGNQPRLRPGQLERLRGDHDADGERAARGTLAVRAMARVHTERLPRDLVADRSTYASASQWQIDLASFRAVIAKPGGCTACEWACPARCSHGMYVVTEADAAAIREAYETGGEFAAAVELRRRFPGIIDNTTAREQARRIAARTPLPPRPARRRKGRGDG